MGLFRRTLRAGALLGGATATGLTAYGYALSRQYPWAPQPSIQTSPALTSRLPPGLGATETLVTTVPGPQTLESFLDAFYACWSLRLEAWVARTLAYKSRLPSPGTGREFAAGLFPELYADGEAAVHWWSAPPAADGTGPAGAHIFSATPRGEGVKIAFGATQMQPPYAPKDPWIMGVLHGFYMRVLFDETRRTMEKWAREGRH
jgi:hypothetical protein